MAGDVGVWFKTVPSVLEKDGFKESVFETLRD
jgi:hypothetical protein